MNHGYYSRAGMNREAGYGLQIPCVMIPSQSGSKIQNLIACGQVEAVTELVLNYLRET